MDIETYREMWEELHNPDFNRVQFEVVKQVEMESVIK